MSTRCAVVILAAFIVLPCCCPAQASSDPTRQASQKEKTGKVNLLTIINSTQEGKKRLGDVEEKFAPKKAALRRLSQEIVDLRKRLSERGGNLSDDERKRFSATLKRKTRSYSSDFELTTKDYISAESSTVAKLSSEAIDVIARYAKAYGYAVIFNDTDSSLSVLWVSDKTSHKLKLSGKPMPKLQEDVFAAFPSANATSIDREIINACDAEAARSGQAKP